MERERVLEIIDAAYAARLRGDAEAVAQIWAEGATFELAGERSLLEGLPNAGSGAAEPTVAGLIALVEFIAVERLETLVEGLRAATLSRIAMSFGGREPVTMLVHHLWHLDEDGKVRSLLEFTDTAKATAEMAMLQ